MFRVYSPSNDDHIKQSFKQLEFFWLENLAKLGAFNFLTKLDPSPPVSQPRLSLLLSPRHADFVLALVRDRPCACLRSTRSTAQSFSSITPACLRLRCAFASTCTRRGCAWLLNREGGEGRGGIVKPKSIDAKYAGRRRVGESKGREVWTRTSPRSPPPQIPSGGWLAPTLWPPLLMFRGQLFHLGMPLLWLGL